MLKEFCINMVMENVSYRKMEVQKAGARIIIERQAFDAVAAALGAAPGQPGAKQIGVIRVQNNCSLPRQHDRRCAGMVLQCRGGK
ncbi:MAG: hypothetical protein AAGJ28_03815 [Pseudomonadota bacterium]